MNFKIAFVGAALMAFGGIFTVGCGGSDCETASDTVAAKYETCGATLPAGTDGDADAECSEAAGKASLCLAACIDKADCALIKVDPAKPAPTDAATSYANCLKDCSTPAS